jgi:hypothetical protein
MKVTVKLNTGRSVMLSRVVMEDVRLALPWRGGE